MPYCNFFIFLGGGGIKFAVNRRIASRRGRSFAQNPDERNKSNSTKTLKVSSTFSKVVGIQRAKPVVAPAGAKHPSAF